MHPKLKTVHFQFLLVPQRNLSPLCCSLLLRMSRWPSPTPQSPQERWHQGRGSEDRDGPGCTLPTEPLTSLRDEPQSSDLLCDPQGVAARPPSPESHGARLNLPGTSSLQGFAALFIAQNDENLCLLQEKCHGPGPHLSLLLPPIPLQGEPSVFSSGPSECHGQTKSHLCGWLQDRVAATAAWVDPGAGLRWLRGTLLPGPLFGNSGWGARDWYLL